MRLQSHPVRAESSTSSPSDRHLRQPFSLNLPDFKAYCTSQRYMYQSQVPTQHSGNPGASETPSCCSYLCDPAGQRLLPDYPRILPDFPPAAVRGMGLLQLATCSSSRTLHIAKERALSVIPSVELPPLRKRVLFPSCHVSCCPRGQRYPFNLSCCVTTATRRSCFTVGGTADVKVRNVRSSCRHAGNCTCTNVGGADAISRLAEEARQ
jgi:hypothetical protein